MSARAGGGVLLLAVTATLATLASCSAQDVVVARLQPGDVDGGGGADAEADARPFGQPCASNDDCSVSSYCERFQCSDAMGVCRKRPTFCDDTREPVCACDGVTFWNDCLRRSRGEPSAVPGECESNPAPCGGASMLPCALDGASCARLFPIDGKCDGPPSKMPDGVCWVLPLSCPVSDDQDPKWNACAPGMMAGCVGTCDAIRDGTPHRATGSGTCPP